LRTRAIRHRTCEAEPSDAAWPRVGGVGTLASVQGVIKSYDPSTGDGVVMRDTDLSEYDLASSALAGSIFRMLRQGQRVIFDLDDAGLATRLRLGSETDMGTPDFLQ
jgi:cold shock CspA family protein